MGPLTAFPLPGEILDLALPSLAEGYAFSSAHLQFVPSEVPRTLLGGPLNPAPVHGGTSGPLGKTGILARLNLGCS